MGKKDIISKRILKRWVRDFATYLFCLPVVEVTLLDTQTQRMKDACPDFVNDQHRVPHQVCERDTRQSWRNRSYRCRKKPITLLAFQGR
jgi:hypothetical protein